VQSLNLIKPERTLFFMKFSHLADCHIGSWKEEKLNNISTEAFIKALDISVSENVDFILIAGDIFNTALPAIEKLKAATKKLREIKEKEIPVYIIPGSHDFSPTGKTMLDVLEHAGLVINVMKGTITQENKLRLKFTINQKTGAKITGILGKKGSLEKNYYEHLDTRAIEEEPGFKIFMFHSAIAELKPAELEKMEAAPASFLPKGCGYYAGGHVHIVKAATLDGYKNIVYPGPLFPNNFAELEKLGNGGFYIYTDGDVKYVPIIIHPTIVIWKEAKQQTPQEIEQQLLKEIENRDLTNAIVTIRISGELREGKTSDINFKLIKEVLEQRGAYFVMKNTNLLKAKEFEEIVIKGDNTADIEQKVIQEHSGQFQSEILSKEEQQQLTETLLHILNTEKQEGERVVDFENRLRKDVESVFKTREE